MLQLSSDGKADRWIPDFKAHLSFRSSPANSCSNPSAAKVVVRKSLQAVARSLVEDVFEVSCGILIQNGISGTLLWTATTTSCDQKRRSKRWSIFKVEEKWTVRLALVFFWDTLVNSWILLLHTEFRHHFSQLSWRSKLTQHSLPQRVPSPGGARWVCHVFFSGEQLASQQPDLCQFLHATQRARPHHTHQPSQLYLRPQFASHDRRLECR